MDKSKIQNKRNGCVLLLRNDHEKTRSNDEELEIKRIAEKIFSGNVVESDMCVDYSIQPDKRLEELEKKYCQLRKSQLVITDRLHGMIFAAITGTPCIVINSKSHKVKGCYEWLKHLEYVKFASNVDMIQDLYESISKKQYCYRNDNLISYMELIKQKIK